jgi:hypothetical protein
MVKLTGFKQLALGFMHNTKLIIYELLPNKLNNHLNNLAIRPNFYYYHLCIHFSAESSANSDRNWISLTEITILHNNYW